MEGTEFGCRGSCTPMERWERASRSRWSDLQKGCSRKSSPSAHRAAKPAAILGPDDSFADDLGQLLVKGAIFKTKAGEKGQAEEEIKRDAARLSTPK